MIFRKTLLFLFATLTIFLISPYEKTLAESQPAAREITGINVEKVGDITEIQIESSSPVFSYTIYNPGDPYKVVVELQGVDPGKFKDKLVIEKAGVLEILFSKVEGAAKTVRLDITLAVPADIKPTQRGKSLVLAFHNLEVEEAEVAPEKELPAAEPEKEQETFEKPEMKVAEAAAPAPEKELPEAAKEVTMSRPEPFSTKEYTGEKISLDFQDADLVHIFRLIADVSGYNLVLSPSVKGRFSMKLLNVPWDQALDIILRNYALSKAVEGNIIRIAPTSVIAQEEDDIAKAKEAALKSGDLETRIYKINYADAKKIQDAIKDIMSQRGKISIDERTSTIILKDVANTHKEFARIIKALDMPTPQVNIEAKIVEVSTNFTKELGVQWGMLWKPTPQSQISGTGLAGGTGFFSTSPLLVNLPAAAGSGTGGAIGFGFVSAKNLRALDLQLSAMENSGKGKIISNPRITTIDNTPATIKQGTEVPYLGSSTGGGTVQDTKFKEAVLELTVTPHITPEGTIVMDILAKNDTVDFSAATQGSAGPPINKKEAQTKVLIKDGDTMVLGGIFKTNTTKSLAGVPGLSKVPVLGWLFKKEQSKDDTTELLIFITPRIVE